MAFRVSGLEVCAQGPHLPRPPASTKPPAPASALYALVPPGPRPPPTTPRPSPHPALPSKPGPAPFQAPPPPSSPPAPTWTSGAGAAPRRACSFRTITCRFHSGMGRPRSSRVGTSPSRSPAGSPSSCSATRLSGAPPAAVSVTCVDRQVVQGPYGPLVREGAEGRTALGKRS